MYRPTEYTSPFVVVSYSYLCVLYIYIAKKEEMRPNGKSSVQYPHTPHPPRDIT